MEVLLKILFIIFFGWFSISEAVYERLSKPSVRFVDTNTHHINSRSSDAIDHVSHANNSSDGTPAEPPKPKVLPVCEVFNFSDGQIYELTSENEKAVRMTVSEDKHSSHEKSHHKKIKKVHLKFGSTEPKDTQEPLPKILQNMQRHYSNHRLVYIPMSGLPLVCNLENRKQTPGSRHLQVEKMAQLQVGPQDKLLRGQISSKNSREKDKNSSRQDLMMTEVDWDELRSKMATRGADSRGSSLYHSAASSRSCSPHSDLDMSSVTPWPDQEQYLKATKESDCREFAREDYHGDLQRETTFQLLPGDPFVLPAIEKSNGLRKSKNDQRIEQKFEETLKIYKRTREKIMSLDKIKEKERKFVRSGKRRRRQFPVELSVQRIEGARPVEKVVNLEERRCKGVDLEKRGAESALQSQKSKIELKSAQRKSTTKLPPITPKPNQTVKSGKEKAATPPKKRSETPQRKMFADGDYDQFSHRKLKTKTGTPRTPRTKQATQNQISRQYDRNEAMQYIKVKIGDDDKKKRRVPAETGVIPEEDTFTEYDRMSLYTTEERETPVE